MFKYLNKDCASYFHSMCRALTLRGHEVTKANIKDEEYFEYENFDFCLNVDSGRDRGGRDSFLSSAPPIPSAVYFIDSHGQPTQHHRLASNYDHVFFAVWSKRDLFAKHPSAHWCPNFTDFNHFNSAKWGGTRIQYDYGFFGSKGGLNRTYPLQEICDKNGQTYTIRQISPPWKHRWPATAQAMAECRVLFNHGQKHDGPNLRVFESMAMCRPLITDIDPKDGMSKLFTAGEHYLGYEAYTYEGLEQVMRTALEYPALVNKIAQNAAHEVRNKHQVGNRIEQILEVICPSA